MEKKASGIKIITENRKASFDYHILEKYEVGLVLTGSEVKSLRNGQMQLKDSYIAFQGNEAFLQKAHIAVYKNSSYNNHEPERHRKLLMHKSELNKLYGAIREKGLSLVPLKAYFKSGKAKLEIALVKGKKTVDKRQDIKKKDIQKQLRQFKQR